MRDGTPAGSIAFSYLAGATREWLTPRPGRRLSLAACALLVAVGSLGVSAGLLPSTAPARAAVTSQPHGPAHCRPGPPEPGPGVIPAIGRRSRDRLGDRAWPSLLTRRRPGRNLPGRRQPAAAGPAGAGPRRKWRRALGELGVTIVVTVLVVSLVRTFALQPFWIPSASMTPTLGVYDRILVQKAFFTWHDVREGDIVVFSEPPF